MEDAITFGHICDGSQGRDAPKHAFNLQVPFGDTQPHVGRQWANVCALFFLTQIIDSD